MSNDDLIKGLETLIDIYAKELYLLDESGSRDWKRQYQLQLKIDRTLMVIDELRKLK